MVFVVSYHAAFRSKFNTPHLRLDGFLSGVESLAGDSLSSLPSLDGDGDDGALGVFDGGLLDGGGGGGDALRQGLHHGGHGVDGGANLAGGAGDDAKGTLDLVRHLVYVVEDGEEVLLGRAWSCRVCVDARVPCAGGGRWCGGGCIEEESVCEDNKHYTIA